MQRETLECPFCGYRLIRDERPGNAYCGPHHADGHYSPAVRMVVVKEKGSWGERWGRCGQRSTIRRWTRSRRSKRYEVDICKG